jgi:hypothetical protein
MAAREAFPILRQFLGGYFHQDWMHDAPDTEGVIKLFVDGSPKEALAGVRSELTKLLNQERSDAELQALLTQLGCYVHYPSLGVSAQEWLAGIRAQISELADTKR